MGQTQNDKSFMFKIAKCENCDCTQTVHNNATAAANRR